MTEQRFEDRLLAELRRHVPIQPEEKPTNRRRVPRRLAVAGGLAALLAAGAAAGVPFLSGGSAPAYAVTDNGDGTVTVDIASLTDASGLQQKLRDAGINAVVQYLPPGKTCKQPWYTPAGRLEAGGTPTQKMRVQGGVRVTQDGHATFTISSDLPDDVTLVITTQGNFTTVNGPQAIAIALAQGAVPPCDVVDAPPGSDPLPPPPGKPGGGDTKVVTHADFESRQQSSQK